MTLNIALEVKGLCKAYDRFALRDVGFTLPEGCIMGFIGANGAGKTTTMKSILKLLPTDKGSIRIFGQEVEGDGRAIKDRIGVVLGEDCFYDSLTMNEMKNILAPAYSRWDEHVFKALMDRFALYPKKKIGTLSRGMRMQFAIALALSHHADLLMMDEPTSGLDPVVRNEILEILAEFMKREGKAVVFSAHITSDLDKVADMLVLIHEGQIVFQEEKDELLERHRIVKGDAADLHEHVRELFLHLRVTEVGFTGVTCCAEEVRKRLEDVVVERPTIEDIFLAYTKGDAA